MGTDGGLLVSTHRLGSCGSPIRLLRAPQRSQTRDHQLRKKMRRNYWAFGMRIDRSIRKG